MAEAVLEINVTEFKAKCLALFKELEARRYEKVVVTRRGRAIAELTPALSEVPDLYGALKGRVIIPPGVDLTEPVLGPERSRWLYPIRSVVATGAVVVGGSDWSVSSRRPPIRSTARSRPSGSRNANAPRPSVSTPRASSSASRC